jgi:hypothetical protein
MKKIDALLKKVEFFERLAVYGDRKSLLAAIAQATPSIGGTPEAEKYLQELSIQPPNTQTTKEQVIVANPPINPKVQEMLNDLLVPHGDIFPLKLDGELGPQTKEALKKFQARYGKSSTVAQVYNAQKNQPVAKSNMNPDGTVAPMGPGLGGIGNTKSTSSGTAGTENKVEGPKA